MFSRIGFLYFFYFLFFGGAPQCTILLLRRALEVYADQIALRLIPEQFIACIFYMTFAVFLFPYQFDLWNILLVTEASLVWVGKGIHYCVSGQKHQVSFSLTTPTINGKPQTRVKRKFQPKVPVTAVLRGFRWSQGSSLDIEKLKGNLPGSRKQELQIPVLKRWLLNYH